MGSGPNGTPSLATREGALRAIEFAKREALAEFRSDGGVRPRAIVFIGKHPDTGEPLRGADDGPAYAIAFVFPDQIAARKHAVGFGAFLREFVERTAACGVIFIAEMWQGTGVARSELPADFSDGFPGRREGIMVSIEHVVFDKPLVFWSQISRDEGGASTAPFSPAGNGMNGNFMNVLKRSAS